MVQENSSSALQQSINWIKFTKWDWQIYSRWRSSFQENPTVGLSEASRLIDSAISKRQGDQRKHSFLEKRKILHKRESGFTKNTQKYIITFTSSTLNVADPDPPLKTETLWLIIGTIFQLTLSKLRYFCKNFSSLL